MILFILFRFTFIFFLFVMYIMEVKNENKEQKTKILIKQKKKAGRKIGQTAVKNKFIIKTHNLKTDEWEDIGLYPSLRKASESLNIPYSLLSDLNIGRSKIYKNFYKVINIIKEKESEKAEETK